MGSRKVEPVPAGADSVGLQIYQLRTAWGLTQEQLARMIGTQQPVIARLEDPDYQGHSLAMLHRIGAALRCRVMVKFVPLRRGHLPRQAGAQQQQPGASRGRGAQRHQPYDSIELSC